MVKDLAIRANAQSIDRGSEEAAASQIEVKLVNRPFEIGDRVLVAGPTGEVIGEVLGVATPDEAPHIEGAPPAELIKDILREFQVDLLLLIEHKHEDRDACFFALRHSGGWRDLGGQDLRITKVGRG